ncbi:MAG: hypothetical protein E6Q97_05165 [Desulfurellales bacterium]|nr:MAG: hypothetical protein E6Q97_05165 [Desulfurellales bacterium]
MFDINIAQVLELEKFLVSVPDATRRAAAYAMNDVLGGQGLARFRKATAAEVQFPAGYVDDKISFDKRATPTDLTASIVGRQRPTSLARFATSGAVGQKGGVTVRVKGGSSFMKDAFLVRLRQGASISDDGYNVGLAIRLKDGMTLNKKDTSRMVRLENNVVLLYGPSVDQILRNEVAEAETPEVVDAIATEFFRQFARIA